MLPIQPDSSSSLPIALTNSSVESELNEIYQAALSTNSSFYEKIHLKSRILKKTNEMSKNSPSFRLWKERSGKLLSAELKACEPLMSDPQKLSGANQNDKLHALDLKIWKKNYDFISKLSKEDAQLAREHFSELLHTAYQRDFSHPEDFDLLESLIESRLLFNMIDPASGKSYLSLLKTEKFQKLFNQLPSSIKQNIEHIAFLTEISNPKMRKSEVFLNCLANQRKIESSLRTISKADPQLGEFFKLIFKEHLETLRYYKSTIEKYQKGEITTLPKKELRYLEEYCVVHRLYDILSHLYKGEVFSPSSPMLQRKILFHLFLDKTLDPKEQDSQGLYIRCSAGGLLRALNTMQTQLTSANPELQPLIHQFYEEFKPLLQNIIILDNPTTNTELTLERIWQKLNSMEPGQKILLPAGSKIHATSLLVKKNDNGTFSLAFYNTGDGIISHHARWQNTSRYQTHFVIDQVPPHSMLKKELWDQLIEHRSKTVDMDAIYATLHEIGKEGIVQPPSENQEDYEARQLSGTCSMQNLLACIRHQLMDNFPGLPEEKEAVYKFLKLALQEGWVKSQSDTIQIDDLLNQIKSKLSLEKQLCDVSTNLSECKKCLSEYQSFLAQHGFQSLGKQMVITDTMNHFQRYAVLRKAANSLKTLLSTNSLEPAPKLFTNPIFNLAFRKQDSQKSMMENFCTTLNEAEAKKNLNQWAGTCLRVICGSDISERGIAEVVRRTKTDNFCFGTNGIDLLKSKISEYPAEFSLPLIEKIETAFSTP